MTPKILLMAVLMTLTLPGCYVLDHGHGRSWQSDRHEHRYGRHPDRHHDYQRDRRGDHPRDPRNRYR